MSNGKKHQKKRKRLCSPIKSQIAIRLEKLRRRRKDLWNDDDDIDKSKQSNIIVLSDSEEGEKSVTSKRKSRKKTTKNLTCLICSILSQLSSYNCCSEHLSLLKHHSHQQNSSWLPNQVMILPVTDEIVQRYLNPEQIHQLKTNGKLSNRSTMTVDISTSPMPPLTSTIVVESVRLNSATIPPDITMTTIEPSVENVTIIDEIQPEASSSLNKPVHDPWIPISDEIDAALEQAIDQIDPSSDSPLEFTPATARRTDTEIMAARLPKIPLKPGRFRHGKPITNRPTTNAANEYRPLATAPVQSSSNTCSLSTTTNVENRSDNILTQDETNEFQTTTQTNEKTTPSRISFRLNPDGTRVSISRPPLSTNAQSPLSSSLRRTSTDVTPISKQV